MPAGNQVPPRRSSIRIGVSISLGTAFLGDSDWAAYLMQFAGFPKLSPLTLHGPGKTLSNVVPSMVCQFLPEEGVSIKGHSCFSALYHSSLHYINTLPLVAVWHCYFESLHLMQKIIPSTKSDLTFDRCQRRDAVVTKIASRPENRRFGDPLANTSDAHMHASSSAFCRRLPYDRSVEKQLWRTMVRTLLQSTTARTHTSTAELFFLHHVRSSAVHPRCSCCWGSATDAPVTETPTYVKTHLLSH